MFLFYCYFFFFQEQRRSMKENEIVFTWVHPCMSFRWPMFEGLLEGSHGEENKVQINKSEILPY